MGIISFQKIFGLCALKCHIVEIWRDVTLVHDGRTDGRTTDGRRTECEDRARILETEFAKTVCFGNFAGQKLSKGSGKNILIKYL